jgi:hypothetical protein
LLLWHNFPFYSGIWPDLSNFSGRVRAWGTLFQVRAGTILAGHAVWTRQLTISCQRQIVFFIMCPVQWSESVRRYFFSFWSGFYVDIFVATEIKMRNIVKAHSFLDLCTFKINYNHTKIISFK